MSKVYIVLGKNTPEKDVFIMGDLTAVEQLVYSSKANTAHFLRALTEKLVSGCLPEPFAVNLDCDPEMVKYVYDAFDERGYDVALIIYPSVEDFFREMKEVRHVSKMSSSQMCRIPQG